MFSKKKAIVNNPAEKKIGNDYKPKGFKETKNQPFNEEILYPKDTSLGEPRSVSENETMARDIKDGKVSGYIGPEIDMSGKVGFEKILRVDGKITGEVYSEDGTLVIGPNGNVDANIAVKVAIINGTVNGDIVASEEIKLGQQARVYGDIKTPSLVVERTAILEGNCNMSNINENLSPQDDARSTSDVQANDNMNVAERSDGIIDISEIEHKENGLQEESNEVNAMSASN